jgi:uncharacterized protein with GYD domain
LPRKAEPAAAMPLRRATESVGGTLEAFYFAFGEDDAYVIADLPDNETAAAVALAVNG